ncbi:MAG: DNA-binding protein WhiA [Eubacterium sp.]|nr:DNA-binding protein WhiA [Eubacterium sp.]
MSFAGEVRQELSRQNARTRHCRLAELTALLFFCGTLQIDADERMQLCFRTEQETAQERFAGLVKKLFGIQPEQIRQEEGTRRSGVAGLRIEEQDLVKKILQATGVLDGRGRLAEERPQAEQKNVQRECCRRAFLRGAFLAAGTVSDPNRSYHAEFLCDTEEQSETVCRILLTFGIRAGTAKRGKHQQVYLKDGSRIADLLGIMEAPVSLMAFENARIMREVRGNINRKVNCETSNIRKTADAAASQIEDVRLIEKTIGLASLPKALDETARVRLQYPTATLQELGELLEVPVGKSGINHRMRRLHNMAEQIRKENTEV